ncbi:hypothetical protein AB1Y20_018342 [Prymnesium parvum]|uniref:Pseudouridine synthase RsuA/RluA-like domain-containing protein n=1 Tax=Prymnesium parvum TaxID=97485 RepID=A0AB34JPP8_PRYPA
MLSLAALPCIACCLASPLRVVHETSGLLFLYKPPGLAFHSSPSSPGLLASVRAMQSSGGFPHAGRLYAVHRLDRVTSGLLMLAKTPAAARDVASLLRARRVHKYYVALTSRRPAKKRGVVRGDMQRSRRGQWRLLRTAENPATTRFFSTPVDSGGRALRALVLRPISGRTHQLRVAMKAVGAALLGDEMYDAAERARMEERTYLHAGALRLPGAAVSWE